MNKPIMFMVLKIMLCITLFTRPLLHAFSSLDEMQAHADSIDEIIAPGNYGYIESKYFSNSTKQRPSIFQRLKALSQKNLYHDTLVECKKILMELVRNREINGFNHRHILQLHHQANDTLIVWGDLQGCFHSCVRALAELQRQGIIDNNLKIIKPNYYLIFNGGIVGDTDHSLELIECIASLMLKNPVQVMCTAGPLEDHGMWANYGLMREVSSLTGLVGVKLSLYPKINEFNSAIHLITRFFNSLPIAIYLDYVQHKPTPKHNLIRISAFNAETPELNTANFNDFFNGNSTKYTLKNHVSIYRLKNVIPTANPAQVRAFITSLPGFTQFEKTKGLIQLAPIDGSIVWSLFSAPSIFQQHINKFYFDAFVKIDLKQKLEEVTIELVHRDARTDEPFNNEVKHLLISGLNVTNKSEQDSVQHHAVTIIGATLDLTKGASNIGTSFRKGVLAALDDGQHNLPLGQSKIRISFFDDKLSTKQSSRNLEEIEASYKLPIIAFPITSQVMSHYLERLSNNSLLALFPLAGSLALHNAKYPGIIFFRPSYALEVQALIKEELPQSPNGNFCFFYQDDAFGRGAFHVAKAEMERLNKSFVAISHLPNETNFSQQIKEFKKHNFSAVFFFSLGIAVREFIQQLSIAGLIHTHLYGISLLGGHEFKHFMQELGLSITLSSVVPNPDNSTLPIVQEYRNSMDKRNLPYNVFSLEGYICSSLLISAASSIKGPINKESLTTYFSNLKNYNFQGLQLNFSTEFRNLSQTVWINDGSPIWKEYREGTFNE